MLNQPNHTGQGDKKIIFIELHDLGHLLQEDSTNLTHMRYGENLVW